MWSFRSRFKLMLKKLALQSTDLALWIAIINMNFLVNSS